ncbi:MAG: hypothetical protein ACM3SQ_16460 [Betaproteobacteria bacterium]
MSGRAELFLGLIAVATLVMAIVQVGLIIVAGQLARRLDRLTDHIERELTPLFASLNAIGRDASRAASLAADQVERADRLFGDAAARIDQTFSALQNNLLGPAREGRALLSALRAALGALRGLREESRMRQRRGDDEDALFI